MRTEVGKITPRIELLMRSPFWAIAPEAIGELLHGFRVGFVPTWEAAKPFTTFAKGNEKNKIAVIPIQGTLTKDGPSWLGSNYDSIVDAAEKAAADPSVSRIILSVDSPGGEVLGLPEAADVLAQVAKVKPVHAVVEGTAASAAYWLASQASDITLTPSGEVGSVGVRMMHLDISKALDDAGLKVTELHAGKFKTEWSPFHPLTDDARADMQTRLDAVHGDFMKAVGDGRGPRARARIRAQHFGGGRMFSATDALGHGLVDSVQAPREFYRAITTGNGDSPLRPPSLQRARLELERAKF